MTENKKRSSIAIPSIRRLPLYLNFLKKLKHEKNEYVSGTVIANHLGLQPIQVRKDLAITGIVGKTKLGFQIDELIKAIEHFLGWDNANDAFLVGTGNLGVALIGYKEFNDKGLNIVAAFDNDKKKIGNKVRNCEILPLDKLATLIKRMHVKIGILTLPAAQAQETAEIMVDAGIVAIWNFTPTSLNVPDSIIVENVRLSSSLSVLTKKLSEIMN